MQENQFNICVKGDEERKYLLDHKVSYKDSIPVNPVLEGERTSIVNDAMFKTMIVNESRKKYACRLLSYVLNVSYDYLLNNLHLYKNVFDKKHNDMKSEEGDFVAVIGDSLISIEMNIKNTLNRNAEYTDRLFSSDIRVGDKNYRYRKVIQINYNNFTFEGHEEVKEVYRVQNDNGELYLPKFYIEIYLPNLRRKMYTLGKEGLTEEEKCILAMFETNNDVARKLSEGDDLLMEFTIELTEPEFGLYQAYDHKKAELEAEYEKGMEIGEERGIAIGEERSQTKIVKKLLSNGYSVEEVCKITELPKKMINKLLKEMNSET